MLVYSILMDPCLPGPSGRLNPDTDSGPADFSTSTNSVVLMYSVFVTVLIITYKTDTDYTIQSNVFITFSLPVEKVSSSRNSNLLNWNSGKWKHLSEFQFNKQVFCLSSWTWEITRSSLFIRNKQNKINKYSMSDYSITFVSPAIALAWASSSSVKTRP